jgi:protein tyrosine/serine phosphatase
MNFGVVQAGMYRGGQPTPDEVAALGRDLNVRTIIRLSRGNPVAERTAARLANIDLIEIPIDPKKVGTADPATQDAVERAFAIFADPRRAPVYIHCDRGRDRTGYLVALYRARAQKWSFPKIRDELARYGHGTVMRRYLPHITAQLAREVKR